MKIQLPESPPQRILLDIIFFLLFMGLAVSRILGSGGLAFIVTDLAVAAFALAMATWRAVRYWRRRK